MTTICLSGLDLSFLKKQPKKKRRTKRVWKHWDDGHNPRARSRRAAPTVMSDIKPFVASAHAGRPVEITSRSQLGRYERSNGIRQCGDIKNGTMVANTKKRHAENMRAAAPRDFRWE